MTHDNKIIYEYCVFRYVPDIEREEFFNIGLLMMSKRYKWIKSTFRIDEKKLGSLATCANIEFLKTQISAYQECDGPNPELPVEERYRWMSAVKSAIIQTSPSHPGIIKCTGQIPEECLEKKFNELFKRLVE